MQRHPRLTLSAVRTRYAQLATEVPSDPWHSHTASEIRRLMRSELAGVLASRLTLNAGAGPDDLGLSTGTVINLDLAEQRLRGLSRPVAGNVEQLPLRDASVDCIVCVGSVVNYCDAAAALLEFSRILRPNGHLVLEFESSLSLELVTQDAFAQSAAVARTFYDSDEEIVWVYHPRHMGQLLQAAGFTPLRAFPIHVWSPLALLLTRSTRIAAQVAQWDRLARISPVLSRWASNILLLAQKHT